MLTYLLCLSTCILTQSYLVLFGVSIRHWVISFFLNFCLGFFPIIMFHYPNQRYLLFQLVQFTQSFPLFVTHGLQHARIPCPSPTPGAYSNSCPSSWWCHPTISSSVIPFSSLLQSFPASGSFPVLLLYTKIKSSILLYENHFFLKSDHLLAISFFH